MNSIRYRIGEAARMAGVSTSTLRLWEAQSLIEPIRTSSGQRLYSREHVKRLKTIAWLRREKGLNSPAIIDRLYRSAAKSAHLLVACSRRRKREKGSSCRSEGPTLATDS